jgi:hypothetical protein
MVSNKLFIVFTAVHLPCTKLWPKFPTEYTMYIYLFIIFICFFLLVLYVQFYFSYVYDEVTRQHSFTVERCSID